VMSLKDGTMAWHLAGFDVVHGAARRPPAVSDAGQKAAREAATRIAARVAIPRIDLATLAAWRAEAALRTLYVLDVRTPEEYEAGHLSGARPAPGGQLVQETDAHIATWGARVVLVDDDGVRATMTASWLKQMGWSEVAVLTLDPAGADRVAGSYQPRVLGLDGAAAPSLDPVGLRERLAAGTALIVDLATSREYARGHIPGAWFAIRAQFAEALSRLPKAETIVLTSPDGTLAQLATADLAGIAAVPVLVLADGTEAWKRAGFPLESGATRMTGEPDDVVLSARERGADREAAMREYLAWEINLVREMASDDDQRFRVVAGGDG
ncbi:MAG: rhodanese-like domain-containing protein, partial [Stellaceae bacterium]